MIVDGQKECVSTELPKGEWEGELCEREEGEVLVEGGGDNCRVH